jgi:hypothetical protein
MLLCQSYHQPMKATLWSGDTRTAVSFGSNPEISVGVLEV